MLGVGPVPSTAVHGAGSLEARGAEQRPSRSPHVRGNPAGTPHVGRGGAQIERRQQLPCHSRLVGGGGGEPWDPKWA